MSIKYALLKKLVVAASLKKRWLSATTEELLEDRRKQNAKNRIPALKDKAFNISRIDVMGFPVLKLIHKEPANKANLFLIGGGMISAPRQASIKKALRFARETGVDVFIPYYPLCTDYPLTKAYEMIHETYKGMLRDYAPERISVLGTSSGGNLALGMVPWENGSGFCYWSCKLLLDTVNGANWRGWDCWDLGKAIDEGWFPVTV